MSLRSPTEHENGWHSQNMLPCSIRQSRARGNPGLFCAELAWIPAFAGMTEPRRLFVVHIIPSHVFSKELTKDTKGSENYYSELRALRVLRGELSFPNFAFFAPFGVKSPEADSHRAQRLDNIQPRRSHR
ncbi:MAG: hypothetical protein ACXW50_25365, partial [Candidatus Binatia bacterium]